MALIPTTPASSARERVTARARHLLPRGQTLPEEAWRRRHKALLTLLWLHVVAIPGYALVQGYGPGHALLEGLPVAAFALLARGVKGRKASSCFVSLGLLTCSALVVHISNGLTEAHFYFFVVVVALTLYEDWTPFLVAVTFVLVHHGLGGALLPDAVYDRAHPWAWAAVHAVFVAAAGAAALVAWRLNEEVRERLRAIVDTSGDAILEIDDEGTIIRSNAAAERVLGPAGFEHVREIALREREGELQTHFTRAGGEKVDLGLTISPVTNPSGAVVSTSVFARDTTETKRQEAALQEAQARFRGAFDGASVGMALVGPDGRWLQVNEALCRIVGYSDAELRATSFQDITHPDDLGTDIENLGRLLSGEIRSYRTEKRYLRRGGRPFWVNLSVALVRDSEGEPLYFVSQVEDVTDRRAALQRLQRAEEAYRTLVERVPAITYVAEAGADGRWHYVSPQIEQMLGYTPEEWQADPTLWFSRVHPDDRERVLEDEESDGSMASEYRLRTRDGRVIWVRDEAVYRDGEGPGYMDGMLTDITERKVLEERLRHMATHDEMTGLMNRGRFSEELGRAVATTRRHGSEGAVLLLDLDNFKEVNDSLGHQTGDRLLKAVATALQARLRGTDVVARLGGDEFAVLLAGTDEAAARAVAAQIVEQVGSLRLEVQERPVRTTASVGIALLAGPGEAADAERLLMEADIAMYRAKGAGGDGFACFTEGAYAGPS